MFQMMEMTMRCSCSKCQYRVLLEEFSLCGAGRSLAEYTELKNGHTALDEIKAFPFCHKKNKLEKCKQFKLGHPQIAEW